jgi:hypothetical protein
VGRFIVVVAFFALQVYALVDLVRSDSAGVRAIPKPLWFLVVLFPVAGPVAWLLLGRPRVGPAPGGGGGGGITGGPRPPRGPIAPDDDPEFLKRLDEQSWAARMERLRREREAGKHLPDEPGESTDSSPGSGSGPSGDKPSGRR